MEVEFPEWLEKNREATTSDQFELYEKQYEIIQVTQKKSKPERQCIVTFFFQNTSKIPNAFTVTLKNIAW